ncbi:STAS domain-containing protein [Lysobacter humi (ex Lee et al. 2017)]
MIGPAQARADGDVLRIEGRLDRAAVSGLWRQLQPQLGGVRAIDLHAVDSVDSAGLALLAELAAGGLRIDGAPSGLAELTAAYRLDGSLGFRT